jgi:hypothetical protein
VTIFLEHLPYLPYDEIRRRAAAFLKEKDRLNPLPIDIEMIVEEDLGLDIIPVPNLRAVIETEAFLSSDLKAISVDESLLKGEAYLRRYRFTLAHEVGHFLLHSHIYGQYRFSLSHEWRNWVSQLDEGQRSWLEKHANDFAGHLLVPTEHLQREVQLLLPDAVKLKEQACRQGVANDDALDFALDWLARKMKPVFEVSDNVVRIRLDREKVFQYLQE